MPWQNLPETLVLLLGVRGPQERGSQVVPAGQIFPGSKPLSGCRRGVCFLFQAFREETHAFEFSRLPSSDSLGGSSNAG